MLILTSGSGVPTSNAFRDQTRNVNGEGAELGSPGHHSPLLKIFMFKYLKHCVAQTKFFIGQVYLLCHQLTTQLASSLNYIWPSTIRIIKTQFCFYHLSKIKMLLGQQIFPSSFSRKFLRLFMRPMRGI